jgi:rubredoxin
LGDASRISRTPPLFWVKVKTYGNRSQSKGRPNCPEDVTELNPGSFFVKSQSGKSGYSVTKAGQNWACDCFDHKFRGVKGKHIHAVEARISEYSTYPAWDVFARALGGAEMTCPECGCLNTKAFSYLGSQMVRYECANCGCVYTVKTQQQVEVTRHGRRA